MRSFLRLFVALFVAAALPLQTFADELRYRSGYTVQLLRFDEAILAVQKLVKTAQGEQPGLSEYNTYAVALGKDGLVPVYAAGLLPSLLVYRTEAPRGDLYKFEFFLDQPFGKAGHLYSREDRIPMLRLYGEVVARCKDANTDCVVISVLFTDTELTETIYGEGRGGSSSAGGAIPGLVIW